MHSKLFRRAIVPAFATALVAGAVAAPAGAKTTDSALADRGPLVINEIDSNDDDWVEIFNTTSQTIPLAGWVLEDRNKDTDTHELADVAAVIPPFGFIVIDPNVNLNKDGEEVVLKDPDGKISDSFQWTKAGDGPDFHRCADGTGDMVQLPSGNSKGTWNCPDKIIDFLNARSDNAIAQAGSESIVINEIATKGTEFVELANKGHEDVDISGWVLFDSGDGAQNQPFVIPSGTKVPAGEYYVATTGSNFGFDGNDGVTVYDASGKKVDSHSWTSHPNDGESWSRLDDMTGAFTSNQLTQGAKNVAPAQVDPKNIVINEVVSNGDPVSDWVELYNKGTAPIDISGWKVIDNDPTHTPIVIPNGTVVQPGDFYAFYTDGAANTPDKSKGFGLGKGDSVTISDANGVEIDSVGWSNGAHATPWGRQPDGTGEFTDLGSNNVKPTRGTTNSSDSNPTTPSTSGVVINEVESNGDPLDDWVELYNMGSDAVDISGWQLTDKGGLSKHKVTIPDGTILQPGEFIAFYVDALAGAGNNGFGLGEADEAVLYDNKGNQIDRIDWTSHSKRTLGRLPDGTGEFSETGKPTRGAANLSPDEVIWAEEPWPFDPQNVDNVVLGADFQIDDTSGVDFDSDGRAWVVNNKTGTLWAFDYNDGKYVAAGSWQLRYPNDNAGQPDAEGVTIGKDGAIYVATERDTRSDDTKKVSRPSVLRFDIPAGTGGTLMATNEWNLKNVVGLVGPNSGLEAIEYIPEQDLYAVGVEATGEVIFLKPNFTEAEIERYKAPFENVMALDYNAVSQELRVVCDEVCDGASIAVKYAQTKFEPVGKAQFDPEKMPEGAANEGFATFTDVGECVQGKKTLTTRFLWADDGLSDNSTALRAASSEETEDCTAPTTTVTAGATTATVATSTVTVPAATTTFTPVTTVADTAVTATETAATSTVKTAGATTTETPVTTVADTAVTATKTAATSTVKTAGATTTETPVTTVTSTNVITSTGKTSTVTSTVEDTKVLSPLTTVAKPLTTTVTPTTTVNAETVTLTAVAATETETPAAVTVTAETPTVAVETPALSVNAPVIVEAVPDATINIPVQASDPQAVKVQGLPEGMAYNPESGAITGSAAAGAYDIAVTQGEGENRLVAKFELRVGKGLATTVTTTSEVPSTGNQSEVDAGSSLDGKCVAALAGWMVPLVALVPLGIASQIELPLPAQVQQMVQGLQEQAARMLPPVDPEIQMLAGGLAAATLGILAIVSIVNACSGGGSSTGSSNA